MNKITEETLLDYISEVGQFDKEHRKYSSFYCTLTYTITQKDIDELAEDNVDASHFLNVQITRHGTWDDSWGTEWDETIYEKVEAYEELVPEVIIPAHTVTKFKTKSFKPVFG